MEHWADTTLASVSIGGNVWMPNRAAGRPEILSTLSARAQSSDHYTGNELLTEIIAMPTLLKVNGVTFMFVRGSWTSRVAYLE